MNILVAMLHIHFLVVNKKIVSYFENFNGLLFLMIEEFDGSFLIRAFLIERECLYSQIQIILKTKLTIEFSKNNGKIEKNIS